MACTDINFECLRPIFCVLLFHRLKREIGSKDVLKEDSSLKATVPVTCKKDVKKAVPGTPLEGEKVSACTQAVQVPCAYSKLPKILTLTK